MNRTNRFPIAQTRFQREKYVFDHAKNVRNTAVVYHFGGLLLFASYLIFSRQIVNLLRVTKIFALARTSSTLYSVSKVLRE